MVWVRGTAGAGKTTAVARGASVRAAGPRVADARSHRRVAPAGCSPTSTRHWPASAGGVRERRRRPGGGTRRTPRRPGCSRTPSAMRRSRSSSTTSSARGRRRGMGRPLGVPPARARRRARRARQPPCGAGDLRAARATGDGDARPSATWRSPSRRPHGRSRPPAGRSTTRRRRSRRPAAGSPASCSRRGAPPDHVRASGGEVDPLSATSRRTSSARSATAEREFLVRTSLLDEVTVRRAEALGERDAPAGSCRCAPLTSRSRSADRGRRDALPPALPRVPARLLERRRDGAVRALHLAPRPAAGARRPPRRGGGRSCSRARDADAAEGAAEVAIVAVLRRLRLRRRGAGSRRSTARRRALGAARRYAELVRGDGQSEE